MLKTVAYVSFNQFLIFNGLWEINESSRNRRLKNPRHHKNIYYLLSLETGFYDGGFFKHNSKEN